MALQNDYNIVSEWNFLCSSPGHKILMFLRAFNMTVEFFVMGSSTLPTKLDGLAKELHNRSDGLA